jgi:phosphate transport system protein
MIDRALRPVREVRPAGGDPNHGIEREPSRMREVFQQELREVQNRLVQMAEVVEVAIRQATEAFGASDVALAEQVIDGAEESDRLAAELDELTIDILARQQPVASDLRLMVGALRMSSSLERMADLAQHIAQLSRYRYPESAIPQGLRKTFGKMAAIDVQMASKLVELLRTQDPRLIDEIRDLDDDLDELHAKVFEKVLSDKVNADAVGVVDATLASRYHERFGDHAVHITKQINFFLSGAVV